MTCLVHSSGGIFCLLHVLSLFPGLPQLQFLIAHMYTKMEGEGLHVHGDVTMIGDRQGAVPDEEP